MKTDNETLLENQYTELCDKLSAHRLPSWNELPDIELYMDQVVAVMEKALSVYCEAASEDNRIISPSIINNYVKLKVIPAPIKKRYCKEHLVYLIMICILKQTLSISSIVKIIEGLTADMSVEELYKIFCLIYREAISFANINEPDYFSAERDEIPETMNTFILRSALISTSGKFLCEGILSVVEEHKDKEKDKD